MVKSICCSSRGPWFGPPNSHGSLQHPLTPFSGTPVLLSDLPGHQARMRYTYMQVGRNAHTHKSLIFRCEGKHARLKGEDSQDLWSDWGQQCPGLETLAHQGLLHPLKSRKTNKPSAITPLCQRERQKGPCLR